MRAGECSGPAGTSLWAKRRAEGGGTRARGGGGARAREWEETVERNCDRARDPSAKPAEQIGPLAGAGAAKLHAGVRDEGKMQLYARGIAASARYSSLGRMFAGLAM